MAPLDNVNDPERITYFGATDSRNKRQPFGIKAKDRSRHMYVIGKTGMGKSTLLENLAIQDIQNGEGMAFIDPHGSSAEKLLDYVPNDRIDDVVYFAPFDMEYPVGFNIMEDVGYDKRHLVVAGLMGTFKKIWVDAWSARMEYILENTLLALLEYPGSTLLDINKMLVVKEFRTKVVENVTDPIVKAFWVEEFAKYTDRYTQEATPAIQNKIGQFTSNPLIRNIVGQPDSSFDVRQLMDSRKLFIANLSKGRMGEKNASLLGSILTTKIYLSAMSRAEESAAVQDKLPDFYFYVDEFQSIANESFADILSEARKYKLALVIAHQYVEQMEEDVRNAVFGNVGTTITFRVGPLDAELLEKVFAPQFTAEDLVNLGFAQIYLTLMIDGVGSPPFSATTLPPIEAPRISHFDDIIAASRNTYAKPRENVEEMVRSRNQTLIEQTEQSEEERQKHEEKAARNRALNSTPKPREGERKEEGKEEPPKKNPVSRKPQGKRSEPQQKREEISLGELKERARKIAEKEQRKESGKERGEKGGGQKKPPHKKTGSKSEKHPRVALREALAALGGEEAPSATDTKEEKNTQNTQKHKREGAPQDAPRNGEPTAGELKKMLEVDDEEETK